MNSQITNEQLSISLTSSARQELLHKAKSFGKRYTFLKRKLEATRESRKKTEDSGKIQRTLTYYESSLSQAQNKLSDYSVSVENSKHNYEKRKQELLEQHQEELRRLKERFSLEIEQKEDKKSKQKSVVDMFENQVKEWSDKLHHNERNKSEKEILMEKEIKEIYESFEDSPSLKTYIDYCGDITDFIKTIDHQKNPLVTPKESTKESTKESMKKAIEPIESLEESDKESVESEESEKSEESPVKPEEPQENPIDRALRKFGEKRSQEKSDEELQVGKFFSSLEKLNQEQINGVLKQGVPTYVKKFANIPPPLPTITYNIITNTKRGAVPKGPTKKVSN
jgi:hypothetical protein